MSESYNRQKSFLLFKFLNKISKELYKSNKEIVIFNFGNEINLVNILIKSLKNEKIPVKLLKENKNIRQEVKESGFLLFDSISSLKEFNMKVIFANEYAKKFKFFVICQNVSVEDISSLEGREVLIPKRQIRLLGHEYYVPDILHFQYFLVEEDEAVKLMTFVWYSQGKCDEQQLIEVNKFERKTHKWENDEFIIKKFDNFHECELVFGMPLNNPATGYAKMRNGSIQYWGFLSYTIQEMENRLNFKFNTNAFNVLIYRSVKAYQPEYVFLSQPFMFLNNYIVFSPPGDFSGYEKLLMPFDIHVWMLIIVTFLASFVVILFLNFTKTSIRNFVLGRNVSTPALNVIMIFFGISQTTLPMRNFARFLAMLFIIYSLIIRTAYQGKMFEFMQQNISKPEVETIEDLIEQNFTFYMRPQAVSEFKKMDFMKR